MIKQKVTIRQHFVFNIVKDMKSERAVLSMKRASVTEETEITAEEILNQI